MCSVDTPSTNAFKTDDELMSVLHQSLTWARGNEHKSTALLYTNLRGALEDLYEASQKGASLTFLSNFEQGLCIGVDQIKSLWKRIGLV
jgi:hypothetical protein